MENTNDYNYGFIKATEKYQSLKKYLFLIIFICIATSAYVVITFYQEKQMIIETLNNEYFILGQKKKVFDMRIDLMKESMNEEMDSLKYYQDIQVTNTPILY